MSTLIIIGHVKDGVDLARQHHLPGPIIELIEQHHGTTLVEYFYHEANRRNGSSPDATTILESAFRYPGPKPQSKEAAILMVSDAVESASRSLSEPTPSRLEGLVAELVDKRLRDGQFDECGLSLQEIADVRESLIKSLIGIYHGRVKYPEQRTA
jgi:membrane-associated HD superfamily phosphohydrolase